MEQEIELCTARPSLDSLNEYVLLNIFKRLKFDDLINLAETCTTFNLVVHRIFSKSTTFKVDEYRISITSTELDLKFILRNKAVDQYIDRLLVHVGPHVSSLKFHCNERYSCSRLIKHIDCEKLKSLEIAYLKEECQNVLFVKKYLYSCRNVELLTLCGNITSKAFLEIFHKLKCFNIHSNKIEVSDLRTVFQNNPEINSFVFEGQDFDYQLLDLISKVEQLGLNEFCQGNGNISSFNTLLTLNQLTKLSLKCHNMNIDNFLVELARKGVIEELELHCVKFDYNSLKILKTFDRLQLLAIHIGYDADTNVRLDSSIVLPLNLKHLRLRDIVTTHKGFYSIIQQAKYLESIDVFTSEFKEYKDAKVLFRKILKAIGDDSNIKHRLDLLVAWCFEVKRDNSKEPLPIHFDYDYELGRLQRPQEPITLIESNRLRILHGIEDKYNLLGIYIKFPGVGHLCCGCMGRE